MIFGVKPRLNHQFKSHTLLVYDILHALPEAFGFADLSDSIDSSIEFRIGTAHTDNLEFPTNDVEWMRKEE